jgi:hypothetical protein
LMYGLITAAVFMAFVFGAMPLWKNGTITFENGDIIGYTSMVIALSMIFFGVKSYRDKYLRGAISIARALQVGLLITVVAGLSYAITWEFYFNLFAPDFMDEYASFCILKAKNSGVSDMEVQKLTSKMDAAKEMYRHPVLRFGMTLAEVLPVGIIISVLSAGLLRKKNFVSLQPT